MFYNNAMTLEQLMDHVAKTREAAIEMVLHSPEESLKVSNFLNEERDKVCSTSEEKKEWDLAFIHQEEGMEAVRVLLEQERKGSNPEADPKK